MRAISQVEQSFLKFSFSYLFLSPDHHCPLPSVPSCCSLPYAPLPALLSPLGQSVPPCGMIYALLLVSSLLHLYSSPCLAWRTPRSRAVQRRISGMRKAQKEKRSIMEWTLSHSLNRYCLLYSRRYASLDDEGVGLSKWRKFQPLWICMSSNPLRPRWTPS